MTKDERAAREVESFEHKGFRVSIQLDDDPLDPRREWENTAVIACWHRRSRLGDRQIEHRTEDEMRAAVEREGDRIAAILPLYCYEHSGITISLSEYSDRFDSGQLGWVYVTERALQAAGHTAIAEEIMRGEVAVYDQYLTGQVYGFVVETADEPREHVDSCWGFYGPLDDVRVQAVAAADAAVHPGRTEGHEDATCAAAPAGARVTGVFSLCGGRANRVANKEGCG